MACASIDTWWRPVEAAASRLFCERALMSARLSFEVIARMSTAEPSRDYLEDALAVGRQKPRMTCACDLSVRVFDKTALLKAPQQSEDLPAVVLDSHGPADRACAQAWRRGDHAQRVHRAWMRSDRHHFGSWRHHRSAVGAAASACLGRSPSKVRLNDVCHQRWRQLPEWAFFAFEHPRADHRQRPQHHQFRDQPCGRSDLRPDDDLLLCLREHRSQCVVQATDALPRACSLDGRLEDQHAI